MSSAIGPQRSETAVGLKIRSAGPEHVQQIAELAAGWQSSDPTWDDGKAGFLVSAYGSATYEELLHRAKYFLVALDGERVAAFLVGYSDADLKPDEELNRRMAEELGSLVVIKQVCTDPSYVRRGLASQLYQRVLDGEKGRTVIAAVVSSPPNVASARFHHAMGFEPYQKFTPGDGLERTVWVHRKQSRELLTQQYRQAVDLYKHEDLLNWNKLNNFFYITTALATVFGVLITAAQDKPINLATRLMLAGSSLLGLITSVGFAAALTAGVQYLQARKAVVTRLEDALVRIGGARVVTSVDGLGGSSRWLELSPTRHVLRLAPAVVGVGWIGALFIALLVKGH